LLAVVDGSGKAVEQYEYDAAGNILSKTIDGKVTTFKYDKANQLVSSTDATGKVTSYDYDAAGRLTKEGDKSYAYGWLDKVVNISESGKLSASFEYGIDNQLSSRTDTTGKSENFTWDGLALIKRDSTNFVNEPAVTGGNPILAFGKDNSKVLFEDILGSSIGSIEGGKFNAINRSAFGESNSDSELNFFTGKPQVEGLGYAFLFRSYRAEQGKWQTQDPIGYPDGWNNLAYCNNMMFFHVDPYGLFESGSSAYISVTTQSGFTAGGYVTSVQEATNFVTIASNLGDDKITNFTYTGHGGAGGVLVINNETGEGISAKDFGITSQGFGEAAHASFADNVNIQLNACGQGSYLSDYLQSFSNGATATGFTGLLVPIGPLSWQTVATHPESWFSGQWVTTIKE